MARDVRKHGFRIVKLKIERFARISAKTTSYDIPYVLRPTSTWPMLAGSFSDSR